MSSFVDSLNLRPQEKRLIVGIAVVAFVVLNYLFVLPHFKDYSRMKYELGRTLGTNQSFTAKIAMDNNPTNGYKWHLAQLRKGGNEAAVVRSFSGAIQLQNTISQDAQKAGVSVQEYAPVNYPHIGTNAASQFFDSKSIKISVEAREESLVDFLYEVGNDPAMIRVRELSLKPADANLHYQLKGLIVLTADYKKDDLAGDAKSVAAKAPAVPPTPMKIPGITTLKTGGGPGPAPGAPANGQMPGTPPANGRNSAQPAQRFANPAGRGPGAPAAPPAFPPPIPPRKPPPGQNPPAAGNNQ